MQMCIERRLWIKHRHKAREDLSNSFVFCLNTTEDLPTSSHLLSLFMHPLTAVAQSVSPSAVSRLCSPGLASRMHAKCPPTLLPPDLPPFFSNNLHSLLFYNCKGLELKCYRQDEILLHDFIGLKHHTQSGKQPSHVWKVNSAAVSGSWNTS